MAFCSQCGSSVTEDMSFCPSCGARLAAQSTAVAVSDGYAAGSYADGGEYSVVLLGRGTCRITDASELLEDILGYSSTEARRLLHAAPAEAAQGLTLTQAQYIAQAFTEYGLQVCVANAQGTYIDLNRFATASIFDRQGNFLPAVAGTLAMLTAANRVLRIAAWRPMDTPPPPFRLGFRRPAPPPHHRRAHHYALPRPMTARPPRPAPAPRRPAAPAPRRPSGPTFRGPAAPGHRPGSPSGRGPGGFGGGRGGR